VIILDTNIVSESFRPRPHSAVIAWLDEQPVASLYLCAPVLAELRFGVERLVAGRRKDDLQLRVDKIERAYFGERLLVLDAPAVAEFGRVTAKRERMGRRIEPMDALIAAIAVSHGAALATRDIDDFVGLGLELINPFNHPAGIG
jgi:toxin FitB